MRTLATIVALASSAAVVTAQGVSGTVRDSVSRLPVAGAVVTLSDSSGAMVARTLSDERGVYSLRAGAPGRRVRAVRIGFRPRDAVIPSAAAGTATFDIEMLRLPIMLQPARVIASGRCPVRRDAALALGLWDQARSGLLAAVVAREENPARMKRLLFVKRMDGNSDRIAAMGVSADSTSGTASSFAAVHTAEHFAQFGFATDSSATATFFAPDADVLLSEAFVGAYCFQIADRDRTRPHEVGLRFVPADNKRGRIDIDGTLWVDTTARAIDDIEFHYLWRPAMAFRSGGTVSFRTMPNGSVLVDRWSLRLVSATEDTVLAISSRSGAFYPSEHDRMYAEETGGELAHASWPAGQSWNAPLGALHLHAVTAEGRPASGTIIALVATPYFGVVDSTGSVNIGQLVPGPYAVRIVDPRIAELGIGVPTTLKFTAIRDSTISATLKVPTAEDMVAARCMDVHQWTPGNAVFIIGRVVTPDGKPVANARVGFTSPGAETHDSFFTGTDGIFQSCRSWYQGADATVLVRGDGITARSERRILTTNLTVIRIVVQPRP